MLELREERLAALAGKYDPELAGGGRARIGVYTVR